MLLNTTHIFTSTINIKIIDINKEVPHEEITVSLLVETQSS